MKPIIRMKSLRLTVIIAAIPLLACAGLTNDAPTNDAPTEQPSPKQGACAQFHGLELPLEGGEIVHCDKRSVNIVHKTASWAPLKQKYVSAIEKQGWRYGGDWTYVAGKKQRDLSKPPRPDFTKGKESMRIDALLVGSDMTVLLQYGQKKRR